MIDFSVKIDRRAKKIGRVLRNSPREYDKALGRALNKTATKARTRAVRALAKATGLKQKRIRKDIEIFKAGKNGLSAQLKFKSRPLNLINFGARQTKKGVSHKAWGTRRIAEGAFIATSNKGTAVFHRHGSPRLPIEPMFGASVAREAAEDQVKSQLDAAVEEEFPRLFAHEVERAKKRLNIS